MKGSISINWGPYGGFRARTFAWGWYLTIGWLELLYMKYEVGDIIRVYKRLALVVESNMAYYGVDDPDYYSGVYIRTASGTWVQYGVYPEGAEDKLQKRVDRYKNDGVEVEVVVKGDPELFREQVEDITEISDSLPEKEAIQQWAALPGVGRTTAERLYQELGEVDGADIDRMTEVEGVGQGTYEKVKDHLS